MDPKGSRLLTYSTMPTVSPACAKVLSSTLHRTLCCSRHRPLSAAHRAAAGHCGVSEGSVSSFKSTTWNKLWSRKGQRKIRDGRSVGNVRRNVYAKFRCAPLHIKKALGIFTELITTTTITTTVAFWDPPSGSKNAVHSLDSSDVFSTVTFSEAILGEIISAATNNSHSYKQQLSLGHHRHNQWPTAGYSCTLFYLFNTDFHIF